MPEPAPANQTDRGESTASDGASSTPDPTSHRKPVRFGLAACGVACVGLGALGVVLPGMPTTIFLIAACWCFARSFPTLEQRLVRTRFFAPFLPFLNRDARMPLRAKLIALAMMWTAIAISTYTLAHAAAEPWVLILIPTLGVVGTVVILSIGRGRHRGACEVH